jgi:DNA-binding transcriptional ArsR family regulator
LRASEFDGTELVEFFRALGDPVRLEMVRSLAHHGEVACTTYENHFSLAKSTISYHVRTMRMAGMIGVRKEGSFYFYQLQSDTFERLAPGLLDSFAAGPDPLAGKEALGRVG